MKKIAVLLFVLAFAGIAFSQTLTAPEVPFRHRLKGTVKDRTSAVYVGIILRFKGEKEETSATANINGDFEVGLLAGRYTVTVDKINSESFIAFINIEENGLNPNDVEFMVDSSHAYCSDGAAMSCPGILKSVKADYPPAARAVRASGEVVVTVKIDKEGKVVSASAISGHALLKATSVAAARKFLFEPTEKDDERTIDLSFVFIPQSSNEKKDIKRYENSYRILVYAPPAVIDITQTTTENS